MYIASTLTADNTYAYGHEKFPEGVTIKGGANRADPRTMVTPSGAVLTRVNDEQVSALNEDHTFKLHKANGFIQITKSKPDEEAVASDLESRDSSAPLTPEDLAADGAKLHETSAPEAPQAPEPPRNSRRA